MPTIDLTRIGSNIGAMSSLQSLLDINNKLAAAQSKLSTGKRINSAQDDPAGLVIATKLNARSQGLKVAMDNISDAKNMMSVAEAGLSKITDILTQMRNKATQAASDTLGGTERATIQTQLSQFAEQINDIVTQTKWNGVNLLSGALSKQFQTGVESGEYTTWSMSVKHDPTALGISSVANNAATLIDTNTNSVRGFSTSGLFSNVTQLATGTYYVSLKDVAASGSQGNISNINNQMASTGSAAWAVVTNGTQTDQDISNANHQVNIVGYNEGSSVLQYNIDGGSTQSTTLSAGSNVLTYKAGATGSNSGVSLWVSDVTTADSFKNLSGTYSFDYVKKNMAEAQLQYADGTAVSVDADGNSSTTGLSSTIFLSGWGSYDTGKGLTISAGTMANMLAQANTSSRASVSYTAQSNYSVDVSSANKAATYMNSLDNAMDTVNQSMANLGSIMARMDIKSATASAAQINVESAYNRIMNANMAEEQVNASKYQVLQQTAVAMLAQSNQAPQAILSLFK